MSAPDLTPDPLPASRLLLRLPTDGVGWWLLVIVCSVGTARLAMMSIQLGCAAALVIMTAGLYAANRTAGLVAVWTIWLLAPALRRIFFLSNPIINSDPLALAPFLATALVVAFEMSAGTLSPRARRILLLGLVGYLIGLPFGFLRAPAAGTFAFFAYVTAVGCFVIGYREGGRGQRLVLPMVLMVMMPLLAIYAYRQYYLPLPHWDLVWFRTADINSAGSPDPGRVRVWSTLNSPGTFGLVAVIATVAFLTVKRLNALHVLGALLVVGALALTYARSSWLGLVAALLVIGFASRGAALKRVLVVGLLMLAVAPIVLSGSAGAAFTDRLNTFGSLGSDKSAQARQATPLEIIPSAIVQPLGVGIGQAGEATRLEGGGLRYTDNGYLSLVFQVGPFGLVFVMSALVMAARSGWRNVRRRAAPPDLLVCGVLAFFFLTMFAGDQLYGVGGMFLWYASGVAVRRDEIGQASAS